MTEPKYVHTFRYDITTLGPGETVLERWPELKVQPDLLKYGAGANDKYLRYAILLSQGSGLHVALPDWTERKNEAMRLAGIAEDDKRRPQVFNLTDHGTQALRWTWLRLFSSRLFRAYIAATVAYDQNCMKVEAPILDGLAALPPMTLHIEIDGSEDLKLSKQRTTYLLDQLALVLGAKGGGIKADGEGRAYLSRNELMSALPAQDEALQAMEMKLFFGEAEMQQLAIERAAAEDAGGGWEAQIFASKK